MLKYWVVTHLAVGESAPFLPGFMQLTRLHNYGAAWSSFSGRTVLLVVFTAVLLAVVTEDTWKAVRTDLRRKMRIDVPGTGIAFTVPLSSIGGKRALGFLTEHQTLTWKEESTLKDTRYELLLVIANQGYTGSIMDAARAAGAGGGTVIHAKGTGMEGAAPFLGMELVNVPMKEDGPDMDIVEKLVAEDDTIKAIWCVPMYSNPGGVVYSDAVVKRFAALKPKAKDFRIFWDNAYCVHHLVDNPPVQANLLEEAKKAGNEDICYMFASTSKITHPGSGIAIIAASQNLSLIHI